MESSYYVFYHILAKDTADVILCSQAHAKKDMMVAFLANKKSECKTVDIVYHCVVLILTLTELYELFLGAMYIGDDKETLDDYKEEETACASWLRRRRKSQGN